MLACKTIQIKYKQLQTSFVSSLHLADHTKPKAPFPRGERVWYSWAYCPSQAPSVCRSCNSVQYPTPALLRISCERGAHNRLRGGLLHHLFY
ncbi:hypothetical protein FKM82_023922 [Ascaphus truei]